MIVISKSRIIISMIIFVVSYLVLTTINSYSLPENDTYVFVHCYDEGTGGTINYPPGTECLYPDNYYNDKGVPNELIDDDLEEEEEEQDEKEHEDWAKAND
jgi:hypothetical protein